ncbi:DNA-processing protein DprA [Parabacteroides sp.]
MTDKQIYQIGLTMINGVGDILARQLLQTFGDAEAVFSEKRQTLEKIPGIGSLTAAEIKRPEVLLQAEKELAFVEKNQITCYFLTDENYPKRLRECPDAPVLFYFKGNADLNASRIISIIGTRHATEYGRTVTEDLVKTLAASFPDLLVVSGLAYGIDVCSHRSALKVNLPTVGVLAHGLDRIYPPAHRSTAVEMLHQGGLLSEFPSGTEPDKPNFVRRNRIVAGLADATIVVESAEKGGSLITADLAFSYGRDVYAFPGRTTDLRSKGCNNLIRQNKAGLITSASDLVSALCWDVEKKASPAPVQAGLLFEDDDRKGMVMILLRDQGELHIDQLAAQLNQPVRELSALLFELEMDGMVKALPGNLYKSLL